MCGKNYKSEDEFIIVKKKWCWKLVPISLKNIGICFWRSFSYPGTRKMLNTISSGFYYTLQNTFQYVKAFDI